MQKQVSHVFLMAIISCIAFVNAQYSITWDNPTNNTRYDNTQITIQVSDYQTSSVTINGSEYLSISFPRAGYSAQRGYPDLPSINKSIIIPDDQDMAVQVIKTEYTEISIPGIAPSKGTIYRNQDPESISYAFNELYQQDTWYPQENVILNSPFIQRDFRGTLAQIYPFQYNPAKKLLRVYKKITFQVVAKGKSTENVLVRDRAIEGLDAEFSSIYENRFLNFQPNRYPVVAEDGSMLIISPADYKDALAPFILWKKKKGLKVELVDVAQAGTAAAALQTYIKSAYEKDKTLKYVLLVGDADKVPTLLVQSKYGADIKFGQIVGTDVYADIFVSRFSVASTADVKTYVDKSFFYETGLKTSDTWLSSVLLTASSDKTQNKWKETDADFINHEFDSLKNAGYTDVLRHNQSGVGGTGCVTGTAASCTEVINKGISFWEYSDHGNKTSYPAVGFSTSNASKLTNKNKYFYTYAVACNSGEFNTSGECFTEALMKNANGGTIGTYCGTIAQPWDPPYAALRDILCINLDRASHKKITLGGLMLNGGMSAQEQCSGTQGKETYESFSLLGDPNLQVYSKTPKAIEIKHPSTINPGRQDVEITGTDGAIVSLFSESQGIQTVGEIKGGSLKLSVTLKNKDPIFVTGMKRNHETYQGKINGSTNILSEFSVSNMSAVYTHSKIVYTLPAQCFTLGKCDVSLNVYDLQGSLVSTIHYTQNNPGTYSIVLTPDKLRIAQGMYLAKLSVNTFQKSLKIMIH